MRIRRDGFTLIELLIVVVVLGVLATIAMAGPWHSVRTRSYVTTVRSDLRSIAFAQELYQANNMVYASTLAALDFEPSDGVVIQITGSGGTGWSAQAIHQSAADISCGIYIGDDYAAGGNPATEANLIECTEY